MKNRIYELFKKYKLAILIAGTIIIIGLIIMIIILTLNNNSSMKEFKNDNYSFSYDNSWKLTKKENTKATLKHNKGSKLDIEIITLEENYKYLAINEMIDDLLYDIQNQNIGFKLISKKEDNITKNKYDGYKMLYENGDKQAIVVVGKVSDKLIMFIYEAKNEYFDILLDSVYNIIYDYNVVEEKFDLTHNIKLETSNINYKESSKINSLLEDIEQYETANNNYYVKYSIPSNFKIKTLNSTYGYYKFSSSEDIKIDLTVSILNNNIYEYLDKNIGGNIYSEYSIYQKDDDYSNYIEQLDKYNDIKYESYIYKNSYNYDKKITYDKNFNMSYTSELNENIVLIQALDNNHIIKFEVSSSKEPIPEKLISMIKIDSAENISSYIPSTKENGFIISSLKRIIHKENDVIEEVKLKVPEKYKEINNSDLIGVNLFEQRNYVLDYNDELEIYNYEVEYNLTGIYSKIDSQIDIANSSLKLYDGYNELSFVGERTLNGKLFKIYDGGYKDVSGIMLTNKNRIEYYVNVKLMLYELPNGGFVTIKIKSNDVQVNDEMLNELTNFEIK